MLTMPTLLSSSGAFLVADLGLGAAYTSTQATSLAELTLTIKTDGTWTLTAGTGDTLGGTPTSGTWLIPGGIAAEHSVRFTPSNQVNTPTITNGAASFTAIASNITVKVEKSLDNASADVLVEITSANGAVSDTTNLAANGA